MTSSQARSTCANIDRMSGSRSTPSLWRSPLRYSSPPSARTRRRIRVRPEDSGAAFVHEVRGRVLLAEAEAAARELHLAATVAGDAEDLLVSLRARFSPRHWPPPASSPVRADQPPVSLTRATPRDRRADLVDQARRGQGTRHRPPRYSRPWPRASGDRRSCRRAQRLVTTLFADVRGYTDQSAADAPADVAERMARSTASPGAVERRGGIVDKFAGDAAVASFNVS